MRTSSGRTRGLPVLAAFLLLMAAGRPALSSGASAFWITASDTLLLGASARGQLGDLMMENDRIAIVIGAIDHVVINARSGGNILDAGSAAARLDALTQVYTHFNNVWPRQAVYDSLTILDDGLGGGAAVVRATGADLEDPTLAVVTEYTLEPANDHITISTEVLNTGETLRESFELGDAIALGDCEKYVPGYGYTTSGLTSSPWIAAASGKVSYGYASPDTATIWGTHGNFWAHMNVRTAYLAPGGSATYSRYLVIGDRDIASVAALIHEITSTPVGSLSCLVTGRSTGSPLAGARIEAIDSDGFPYLEMMTAPDGLATATLPVGTWRLTATAKNHLSSERWLTVGLGGEAEHSFLLEWDPSIPPTGDTLTVIQRPLLNIPSFVLPGDTLAIECSADPATTGWTAELLRGREAVWLPVVSSTYDPSTLWWNLEAEVPGDIEATLYDLVVTADGGIEDTTRHAVQVIPAFKDDYYFIQLTDTHLPTHDFSSNGWVSPDTSEMVDLREVIADINLINPEFVLLTGDLVNEGELEDYLSARVYTKAQRMLTEFEVPVFLIAGNHDLGGWIPTPPPDGTARRDWWRFFGWSRLDAPPPGAPLYTQNYSFDYGPVHFVALEAYDNYDRWRSEIYGGESFTQGQLDWLASDLAAATESEAQVLFYHYDFSRQLNINALGVEMALWGHIHRNSGSLSGPPYNLSTNNVCDRERSYRIVRVSNDELFPLATISAGHNGTNLKVDFDPPNDGTHASVTASITNNHSERFEHGMVRFKMPAVCDSVEVTGGTLLRVEDLGSLAAYYVGVDILASMSQTVTLAIDSSCTRPPASLWLGPNLPNPFSLGTSFKFALPRSGPVRLAIYDVQGREVAVLVERHMDAGEHESVWAGRDRDDREVASGIYFAGLTLGSETRSRKIVLMR